MMIKNPLPVSQSAYPLKSQLLVDRFANSWTTRAGVKKEEINPFFEENKEDFLEDLLPFKKSSQYLECEPGMKSKVLSCGWLMYNAKTVQIEMDIVSPSCMHIITGDMPGLQHDANVQRAVCEALVDESYHVYLVEEANRLTRKWRGLEHITIPQFHLVGYMKEHQKLFDRPIQKRMVQFATTIVSEIFISDYLHLLSETSEIQEFNRLTIAAHRHDEMAHSPLFKSLAKLFFYALPEEDKKLFADILPKPVTWFADRELDVWLSLLNQIGFPNADKMIAECRKQGEIDLIRIDYSGIVNLAREIGMFDSAAGLESFTRQGLLN